MLEKTVKEVLNGTAAFFGERKRPEERLSRSNITRVMVNYGSSFLRDEELGWTAVDKLDEFLVGNVRTFPMTAKDAIALLNEIALGL